MMKKISITLVLFSIVSLAFAQEKGAIRLSGALAYGTEIEELGINFGGEYFFTNEISGGINYTIFLVSDPASYNELNFDGRYYFLKEKAQVYGLLGLSSATSKFEGTVFGVPFSVKDSEVGLNIGAGVVYPLSDKVGLNGQLKYATPFNGQLVLQGGVVFRVK